MNPQMNFLYLQATGHILAAFTRAGLPQQPETKPDSFVGAGLLVRGLEKTTDATVIMPAGQISILQTDLDPSKLRSFRSNYVTADKKVLGLNGGSVTVPSSSGRMLSVTIPSSPLPLNTLNMLVSVQSSSLSSPFFSSQLSPALTTTTIVDLSSLPSGAYTFFVAVTSFPLLIESLTLT